jgi:hypothetical protein
VRFVRCVEPRGFVPFASAPARARRGIRPAGIGWHRKVGDSRLRPHRWHRIRRHCISRDQDAGACMPCGRRQRRRGGTAGREQQKRQRRPVPRPPPPSSSEVRAPPHKKDRNADHQKRQSNYCCSCHEPKGLRNTRRTRRSFCLPLHASCEKRKEGGTRVVPSPHGRGSQLARTRTPSAK